ESNPDLKWEETLAEVKATLPFLSTNGEMRPDEVAQLIDWMFARGMIQRKPPASTLFTNDFVAQEP
ncbi:MAG TPA: hypothetical protein VFS26_03465, partial [Solirubrobacterales bacterium]|nr:hypothetical protein [Solirubrobacterales bacterium]